MNLYRKIVSIIVLGVLLGGCSSKDNDSRVLDPIDYSNQDMWFNLPSQIDKSTDIFYVLPTCVWDWEDENGEISHYADINNIDQREAMQESYELAQEIFANESSNFFAPYYQQITLESWMEGDAVVSERFPYAMQDVQDAFDYYIKNYNDGRPFILAGFSQGGKAVVELLKTLSDQEYSMMVAAYVVGYKVTDSDLANYSNIKAATSSNDTGVTICYSSVESPESICEVLSPSAICINPINWKTDDTVAMLNDTVTVRVDCDNKVLLVEGLDSSQYFLPILESLFVEGNYHLYELNFYQESLKSNTKERIAQF